MILTKANVLAYMKAAGQVGLAKIKHQFEVYDGDVKKQAKLEAMLAGLVKKGAIKVVEADSAALSLFGRAMVIALKLPMSQPEYIYSEARYEN